MNYNNKIENISSLLQRSYKDGVIDESFYESLNSRIRNHEFRITIVGEFSSGKSTLLDAILGKDILPHSVSETTATLTYIHSVKNGDPLEDSAIITFVDENTKTVNLDELRDYSTAFSTTVNVFTQIDHVDVYTHIENLDSNIVLVDTPGLNGTNHFEDKTLQEISKADASIFVFSPSGIKSTELSFMKEELLKYQSSFFYIMNKVDDIKESEGENVETKIKELTQQISELFFDNTVVPKNVIGVSSLKALVAKDKSIKKLYLDDLYEINEEDRQRYWEESNFDTFLDQLKSYLKEEKENVFINSLLSQLSIFLGDKLSEINQGIEANSPKEDLPETAIVLDEINTSKYRFDSYNKNLSKNINARMDDVENKLQSLISEAVVAGKTKFEEESRRIQAIENIEQFNQTYGKDGSKASIIVSGFYDRIFERINRNIFDELNIVENDLVLEIKKMIPNISSLKKRDTDTITIGEKSYKGIEPLDSGKNNAIIQGLKDDIDRLNTKISQKKYEKQIADSKASDLRSQQNSLSIQLNNVARNIENLGYRPSVSYKEVTRYRTVRVKDNGFTNLWGLFGDRYREKTESYTDYLEDSSERDEYDRKKASLNSERITLNNKLQNIRTQISALPDLSEELRQLERDYERQKEKIEFEQKEIERAQIEYNQKKRQGEYAFLQSRKSDLIKVLTEVLCFAQSPLYMSLKKDTAKYLQDRREILEEIIRSYFKQESEKYISHLNTMLATLKSSTKNVEVEKKRESLIVNKGLINNYISEIKKLHI